LAAGTENQCDVLLASLHAGLHRVSAQLAPCTKLVGRRPQSGDRKRPVGSRMPAAPCPALPLAERRLHENAAKAVAAAVHDPTSDTEALLQLEVTFRNMTESPITIPTLNLHLTQRGATRPAACCVAWPTSPKKVLLANEAYRLLIKPHELEWCHEKHRVRGECQL